MCKVTYVHGGVLQLMPSGVQIPPRDIGMVPTRYDDPEINVEYWEALPEAILRDWRAGAPANRLIVCAPSINDVMDERYSTTQRKTKA